MELIPIVALICLVASLGVFFLSVGAYYVHKRKSKGLPQKRKSEPYIKASLYAPIDHYEEEHHEHHEHHEYTETVEVIYTEKEKPFNPPEEIKTIPGNIYNRPVPNVEEEHGGKRYIKMWR